MEERKYCVYMHTSPSGKRYIGITGQKPTGRWRNGGVGYKSQRYFWRAIQKYGWENIQHEILFENLTQKEAEQKEIELIACYKSNNKEYGYNIDPGGKSSPRSEETKRKLSEIHKGKSYYVATPETRKLLSEKTSGENNPMYGKRHSEETKKKMSKDRQGKEHEWNRQKIYCVELNKVFNSIKIASEELHISLTHICSVCNGRRKTCGGYHWFYLYDQTKKDSSIIQGAISLGYITEEEVKNENYCI